MEEFDSSKDYKTLHLQWIKNNRSFRPKSGIDLAFTSYYDQMLAYYFSTDAVYKQQYTAYRIIQEDYQWSKKSKTINEEIAVMCGDKFEPLGDSFFVTINMNEKLFDPDKALKAVSKLFEKSYVSYGYAIFEYNTSQGAHPHIHMKLIVNKYNCKSKLLEKLYDSYLGKLTDGKNFIDIKKWLSIHQDYLEYDKAISKKEYLEKDKIWRKENNLPEYLEKK